MKDGAMASKCNNTYGVLKGEVLWKVYHSSCLWGSSWGLLVAELHSVEFWR